MKYSLSRRCQKPIRLSAKGGAHHRIEAAT
jgi:hypothetical protein